jgi:glutathione-regulated potassium-efflux system ancillary protein KefG
MSEPRAQRVLVLFAHPAFHRSRVQRRLARAVRDLPGVTFHDLYDAYPDLDVDVPVEQALLLRHDVVVLQHPLFWYAGPPIVKQWMDLVLEHGWAFGRGGAALVGKRLLCALSTGGSQPSYARDGFNRFTLREFLAPVEQSMRLCGVDFLPPFVVYGTHAMQDADIERAADEYEQVIAALRDGRIDLEAARSRERLSAELVRTPVAR